MKKRILLFLAPLVLLGCQSTPPALIVSPQMQNTIQLNVVGQSASLRVQDMRKYSYLVKINSGKEQAELRNATHNAQHIVEQLFGASLQSAGMRIDAASHTAILVNIHELHMQIDESTVSHVANTKVSLQLIAQKNGRTFKNTYSVSGSQEGAFSADNATMERQLNKHIGNAVAQIVNDPQFNIFLNRE